MPILGPVEHEEQLFQKEAAREALLSHRASRNFRNIWYHYPEAFDEFRSLVRSTWPGMDIKKPEVDSSHEKPLLLMFCPEQRIDREIYWAGFGFQVWCQMLTFIVANRNSSLLVIDEPDIYLHSDLQRQLITILRSLGPDILIATHSTEIIMEADPNEILVISKKTQSAKRVKDPVQLRSIFAPLWFEPQPIPHAGRPNEANCVRRREGLSTILKIRCQAGLKSGRNAIGLCGRSHRRLQPC